VLPIFCINLRSSCCTSDLARPCPLPSHLFLLSFPTHFWLAPDCAAGFRNTRELGLECVLYVVRGDLGANLIRVECVQPASAVTF
jgi:hypothetical protein